MAQSSSVKLTAPIHEISRAFTESDDAATTAAIYIPAGSFVPPFGVTVYCAEAVAGTTPGVDVGDGGDTTGWVDNAACGTCAATGCYSGTDAYAITGKYYSSDDTIDITLTSTVTGGTVYVACTYYDWTDLDVAAS